MRNEDEVILDHSIYVPEGAERIKNDPIGFPDEIEDETVEGATTSDLPPVPETFKIISQTLRTKASGAQVVDVVIETDDFPGITKIDVRVTKEDVNE